MNRRRWMKTILGSNLMFVSSAKVYNETRDLKERTDQTLRLAKTVYSKLTEIQRKKFFEFATRNWLISSDSKLPSLSQLKEAIASDFRSDEYMYVDSLMLSKTEVSWYVYVARVASLG